MTMDPSSLTVSVGAIPALAELDGALLARLQKDARLARLVRGATLSFEGRPNDTATVLVDGQVMGFKGDGKQTRSRWGPGAVFGLWGARGRAPATFIAVTPATAMMVPVALLARLGLVGHFARFAPKIRVRDLGHGGEHVVDMHLVTRYLGRKRRRRALDLGSGAGGFAGFLHGVADHVTLLDPSKDALDRARRNLAWPSGTTWFDCHVGTAERLPFGDGSFDLVSSRLSAHHVPDFEAMLAESHRVLRRGGELVVSDIVSSPKLQDVVNRLERLVDTTHVSARTVGEWTRGLSRAGFEIVQRATLLRPALISERPYGAVARRCAAMLRALGPAERRSLGVFERAGELGWTDRRFVFRAAAR